MTTKDVFHLVCKHFDKQHLAVCSLGRTAEECFHQLPHEQVLFLDCLGSITDTAIGVSLGCPDTWVDAFDTDGSFLANLATIYTLASLQESLSRFTLFIFDNRILESGGGKKSRAIDLDWYHMFAAWGIPVQIISNCHQLNQHLTVRPTVATLQVIILNIDNKNIPNSCQKDIDGKESKYMFKRYIHENLKEGIIRPCLKN